MSDTLAVFTVIQVDLLSITMDRSATETSRALVEFYLVVTVTNCDHMRCARIISGVSPLAEFSSTNGMDIVLNSP